MAELLSWRSVLALSKFGPITVNKQNINKSYEAMGFRIKRCSFIDIEINLIFYLFQTCMGHSTTDYRKLPNISKQLLEC